MCSVSFQMPKILGTTYFINNYNLEIEFGAKKVYCYGLDTCRAVYGTKRHQIKEEKMLSNKTFPIIK